MNPMPSPPAWALPAAAGCGAVVAWLVAMAVRRLVEPREKRHGGGRLAIGPVVAGGAGVAVALWWWEVMQRGQLPSEIAIDVTLWTLACRWAGHVALFGLLAAATWIDLRDRVIPDAITMPGVLAGLAWAGVRPDGLPPVIGETPRSFATPVLEADVLGLGGPLAATSLPPWLGAAPVVAGLAVASFVFVAWWLGCTAPRAAVVPGRRPFDPRLPLLAAGLVGIGAAWWRGGEHWAALLSAIMGMATGVAVVWTTRIGASRALGREAVGFGDVTLMAVIGAWLGWQAAILVCCIGVLVGLAHGLVQFAFARDHELPFGPSLCVGAAVVVVLWRPLWSRLGPVFDRPLEVAAVAAAVIVLTALTLAAWWRLRGAHAG